MDVGLLQASVGQILLQYNKYRPNIYNIYIFFLHQLASSFLMTHHAADSRVMSRPSLTPPSTGQIISGAVFFPSS